MNVTDDMVKKVAELCQLKVERQDVASLAGGMQNILDLAGQMQSVDTTGVEPLAHPLDATQELRTDEVTEKDQRSLFQSVAPAVEGGLYLVPRVVE